MRPPIHSEKHYVQVSLATVTAGQNVQTDIAKGVTVLNKNLVSEVVEGALVKAVFIEMWVRTNDTSGGTALVTLAKCPAGTNCTFADQAALNAYDNKKNVLYHTQGLTNINTDSSTPFLRGWIKIPKSKQRFGLGDTLILAVAAQALDQNMCGFATYKEYT